MIDEALRLALKTSGHGEFVEILNYAVLPAGKLFRPRLIEAMAQDLSGEFKAQHLQLALAVEIHHAYTLVHDDLPAMDNDLIRRGRPSTHAKYGEWQAILAGDALLVLSFAELARIRHPHAIQVHRLFTWATGAKGLLLGQYLDLKAAGKLTFAQTLRVHELKTARLIQTATLGTYLLSTEKTCLRDTVRFLRLGRDIGVGFQLLDDLSELAGADISNHEKEINPFLLAPEVALQELQQTMISIQQLLKDYSLNHTQNMLGNYFGQMQTSLMAKQEKIAQHIRPVNFLKQLEQWLTNFASL